MTSRIFDGRGVAKAIRERVRQEVAKLRVQADTTPSLVSIIVGDDPASAVYAETKENACRAAEINHTLYRLPADANEDKVLAALGRFNEDRRVHGIIVQFPLPHHIPEGRVRCGISPLKDVDGIHPENLGLLMMGASRFVPCTPLGIWMLLQRSHIEVQGRHAVILGRSNVVGRPLAALLLQKDCHSNATVTVCHTGTRNIEYYASQADILVAAMGQPKIVQASWVKPGAIVIDVGVHQLADGTLCGDVDFDQVSTVASLVTPVPGGVGPMTVAMLLQNTLDAARLSLTR
jgi:methylenetetrahydrofolate dehydrogenase (NADP+)/methenyltetrahydrofolate cyclohydrolase